MTLSAKKCVPCMGGIPPLNEEQCAPLLKQTPHWKLNFQKGQPVAISRHCSFKNFRQAQAFVNEVAEIAESENHHPDITFGWGYADIMVQTHTINGLHENDFILAAKIDELLK